MNGVLSYLLLAVGAILQTTLLQSLSVFHVVPNVVLLVVLCRCLNEDEPISAAIYGAVGGLLLDVTGGSVQGLQTILMLYLALGAMLVGNSFFRGTLRVTVVFAIAATVLYELVYTLFTLMIFGNGGFGTILLRILIEGLYHAVAVIPVYYLTALLKSRRNDFWEM